MKVLIVLGNGRSDDTLGDHALPINLANALAELGVEVTIFANSKDNHSVDSRINVVEHLSKSSRWAKDLIISSGKYYQENNFDHVSYHFSTFSVIPWIAKLDDHIRISYINHSPLVGGISTFNIIDSIKSLNTKPNLKVVSISDYLQSEWKKLTDVPEDESFPNDCRINNGVVYSSRNSIVPIEKRNGKLIHVARIDQLKNTKWIVDFVNKYEIPTIIVGQPQKRVTGSQTYGEECVEMIKKSPFIEYYPKLPNDEVRALMAESSMSINVSNAEGMCLALLESYSVGTPILSSTTCKANEELLTIDGTDTSHLGGEYVNVYRKQYNKKLELLYEGYQQLKDNPRNPYEIYDRTKKYYDINVVARNYLSMMESMI